MFELRMAEETGHADALQAARQRARWVRALGGVGVTLTAMWAFMPGEDFRNGEVSLPSFTTKVVTAPTPPLPRLDVASFNAPLWREPPSAEEMGPPRPPPPPLRLQLLGMRGGEHGRLSAIIYDAELDEIETVQLEQEYRGFRVTQMSHNGVELRTENHRLFLPMEGESETSQRGDK
jgi:hypothetical protein